MNYKSQNQNGNAAEYFTAYKFTSLFKWPFRLYGVDLGVDGEFEILDEANMSTGNIVKVQIKSITSQSSSTGNVYVYPSEKQIEYWKTFCAPVVMCAVDLDSLGVYWTQINETNAYVSPDGKTRIDLDRVNNLLTHDSASALRDLVTPPDVHKIRQLFSDLKTTISDVVDEYGNISVAVGIKSGEKFQDIANSASVIIDQVRELAKYYPWKLSLSDRALIEKAEAVSRIIRQRGDEAICDHYG